MQRLLALIVVLRFATAVLLGGGVAQALAQDDPPGRVARLNYSEGRVAYAPSGDSEWTDADLNRPLLPGDRLWTDSGVRAEIQVGSSLVRMDGRTRLTVLALDDRSAQLSLTQGTLYLRVRSLPEGENFEVDTPNLAWRAAYPGEYRVDVDAPGGVTRVTVQSGTGAVYGEQGQVLPMGGGQRIAFKGRLLEKANVPEPSPPQDKFDRWAAERNRRDDRSVAARYVPRELVGYQLLDAAGEWRRDAKHGPVWVPQGLPANWAPYRQGRWDWIPPWGWTWIDAAPWAFVTSHYGRWALIGTRWAWAPGRPGLRPVYAPALVAFVGGNGASVSAAGKPGVAWFPLAPGEPWQPAYPATPQYVSRANANLPPLKEGAYAYQRRPEALTALARDDDQHGTPEPKTRAAEPPKQTAQPQPARAAAQKAQPARRELQARRAQPSRRVAVAKKHEAPRRATQAQQRAAREAWRRQQQALAEQFRRDQQAWQDSQKARPSGGS